VGWIDTSEIREKAKHATAAPWCVHPNGCSVWSGPEYDSDDPGQTQVARTWQTEQGVDDAFFIAEARADVLALCDEVDRLRAELQALRKDALARGVHLDNGRTLRCNICGEVATGVCTHIADARLSPPASREYKYYRARELHATQADTAAEVRTLIDPPVLAYASRVVDAMLCEASPPPWTEEQSLAFELVEAAKTIQSYRRVVTMMREEREGEKT
jgi:hypothetical protein